MGIAGDTLFLTREAGERTRFVAADIDSISYKKSDAKTMATKGAIAGALGGGIFGSFVHIGVSDERKVPVGGALIGAALGAAIGSLAGVIAGQIAGDWVRIYP